MSQQNFEVVRRGLQAFERGDIPTMLADLHPGLITHRAPPQPDSGTWSGPEGVLEALADWTEGFDQFTMTVSEVIDANEEQVIACTHQTAVGHQSLTPVEADFWLLFTFRDGKVGRIDIYARREHAFEAAGLGG
jgi:ketosteroid isomerase-like protein